MKAVSKQFASGNEGALAENVDRFTSSDDIIVSKA